jgi:peptide/nickel transport system permease protein
MNRRRRTLVFGLGGAALLLALIAGSALLPAHALDTNLAARGLAPDWRHPFGTDWLGRDMFARTVKGLALSIRVGLLGALGSVAIAAVLGAAAAAGGRWIDRAVTWLIDLFLSVPHLVALMLIAFATGGGVKGVVIGIALTHWPSLARVIRAEALQLAGAEYVQISRRLGRSRAWIACRHMGPHLVPQLLVGFLLLFPHAILHEAAITFLGLGLSPHEPAIGIILSESMQYLSAGMWWLAVFPGLALLVVVRAFAGAGEGLRLLLHPRRAQE